jgi:hypothetical protein
MRVVARVGEGVGPRDVPERVSVRPPVSASRCGDGAEQAGRTDG